MLSLFSDFSLERMALICWYNLLFYWSSNLFRSACWKLCLLESIWSKQQNTEINVELKTRLQEQQERQGALRRDSKWSLAFYSPGKARLSHCVKLQHKKSTSSNCMKLQLLKCIWSIVDKIKYYSVQQNADKCGKVSLEIRFQGRFVEFPVSHSFSP